MWDMVGYSFYSFEGIGVVMPIMESAKDKEGFPKVLTIAIFTLAGLYLSFGVLSYKYFGHMKEKFVIYNLDDSGWFLKITELAFCLNLVFSYPITIYPANKIMEGFIFYKMKENTPLRKALKNLYRTFVCFLACLFAIMFARSIDQFLVVTGSILGITIILIVPTVIHYKLISETKQ